jgi:galactose-1-phosphate uridylyltransferase
MILLYMILIILHGVFLLMGRQIRAPITVDSATTTTALSLTVNSSHVNHRRNTRTTPIARQKEYKPLAFGRCELCICVCGFSRRKTIPVELAHHPIYNTIWISWATAQE